MQIKKFVATGLAALMAGVTLAGAALAATQLGTALNTIGQQAVSGVPYLVVVGEKAAPSDVVGAIDVASALAQQVYTKEQVPGVTVTKLTGGVSLDTADTKIYLTDNINKAKSILTSNDLPTLLASDSVEDESGATYDYSQYINVGGKVVEYTQPDVSSGLKEPAYLIKLGTSPSSSDYLIQAWASFTKPFNASKAVGKEIKLFGKTFTISAETDSSKLVLFGLAGKETIGAGESKTITVGDTSHTVTVVGIIDSSSAVLEVDGIQKEVVEGKTYDFGGTSVYVANVFYYKVPTETGSVEVSIGADRYVLKDGSAIYKGTSGNEVEVKGTYVTFGGNPQDLTDLKVSFDAYSATPAVDYIKASNTWTDPFFGTIKVSYNGPASIDSEDIVVQPGATNYYTISFTDKYGKSGTVAWVYDNDVGTAGGETLADSAGNAIHVVEGESAGVGEYVFVSAGSFPHMLKVSSADFTSSTMSVTFKDVFSGTEYKVTNSTTTTGTLVIDGQQYTVTFDSGNEKVSVVDNEAGTVVYPVLETKYGAKIAFTEPLTTTLTGTIVLPTGSIDITTIGNSTTQIDTVGAVIYNITGTDTDKDGHYDQLNSIKLAYTDKPAIVLIEEQTKAGNQDAIIIPVANDATTDKRLELQSLAYTHASGNIYSGVGTSSDSVTHTVTEWGTKVVIDKTAAGTATITYPDEQVYHQIALGTNPSWTTTTAGGTYNKIVPLTTTVAKLDSEVTAAEKTNDNLILVGGPCVNDLVAELANAGTFPYTCESWPGSNFGVIKAIDDAFASGKLALVVAGTRAEDTRLATSALALGNLGDAASSDTAYVTESGVTTVAPA